MLNFKIKGSCLIKVVDSRSGEVKQVIEKENLITNNALYWVLDWSPRGIFDYFGIGGSGYGTNIFISTNTAQPNANASGVSVLAQAYDPSGVTKKTFYPNANPVYGQLQQRIDFTGTARTFQTVGLKDAGRTNVIYAYLLLDTPCTQGVFDYLDLFYRIQFINAGGQGLATDDALLDFARGCFDLSRFNMQWYNPWVGVAPASSFPYKRYGGALGLFNPGNNSSTIGSLGASIEGSHYKFKMTHSFSQFQAVGYIFGCMTQGAASAGGYHTLTNVINPNAPFQNIFTHSASATVPFFDSLTSAGGNGKIRTSGTWTGKFPELYKITMVTGGATGVATYKYSVRKHLGFAGNSYSDLAFNSPYRIDLPGFHGMKEENNDLLRWSNTQIVQYDSTGVMLLDVYDGNYKIWDATTTPQLAATTIRQCAVDTANQKIYVGCRSTGLWVIDVAANTVTQPFTNPCYGVDVGRNNVAYALIDGGLYRSSDWSTPLSFTYAGVTDNNWNRVLFLKADPEHSSDRIAMVVTVPSQSNGVVWFEAGITPFLGQTAQHWRVKNTVAATGGDRQWIVRELVFRDAGGNDITSGGTAMASGSQSTAGLAFDKNINTFWNGAGLGVVNSTLGYSFANSVTVASISINNLNNGSNIPPTSYIVEYSTDNTTWNTAWSFTTGTADNTYYNSSDPNLAGIFSGPQSSSIKSYPASLDVSDTGSFWVCGAGRLTFGSTNLGSLGGSLTSYQFTHPIYGNDAYYKIAFYNQYLILRDRIVDINGTTINTYSTLGQFTSQSGRSAVLHLDSGIVILSGYLRQLFTDNSYCWQNFGWNGSAWELNHPGVKTTHADDQLLGNGINIRFENGANAPHFIGTDYYTQGICWGKFKDNASTISHNSCWYSVGAIFDAPINATIPNSPVSPSPAQFWRVRTLNVASGSTGHFRVFELVFRDNSGTDITTGGTASSSHNNASANNAFDKNNSTFYTSNQYVGAANITLQYTFATEVSVSQVSLLLNRDASNVQPTQFAVESSTNGTTWTLIWSFDTGGNNNFTSILSNYFVTVPAASNPDFRRVETDSKELHKFYLNGTPVTTVYCDNNDVYTAPGINEVFVRSDGKVFFNPADAAKTFSGTYAYLKY